MGQNRAMKEQGHWKMNFSHSYSTPGWPVVLTGSLVAASTPLEIFTQSADPQAAPEVFNLWE